MILFDTEKGCYHFQALCEGFLKNIEEILDKDFF
jgi:hypothetical protein